MSWLGGPLPGYEGETEIGLYPGNPDWVAPFTGPVISNPFAKSSEPSIGEQVGDIAGEYLAQYSNPIKGAASGSGSMLDDDDDEGGIEKITDGLYLYNPGKFVANYAAGMQGGGSKSSGGLSGLIKTAAPIAINLGLKSLMACDMRLKTDVLPLETTDVNDDLAEMAFFVKGLRECA